MTSGLPSGLRVTDWKRAPERPRAAPAPMPVTRRGPRRPAQDEAVLALGAAEDGAREFVERDAEAAQAQRGDGGQDGEDQQDEGDDHGDPPQRQGECGADPQVAAGADGRGGGRGGAVLELGGGHEVPFIRRTA